MGAKYSAPGHLSSDNLPKSHSQQEKKVSLQMLVGMAQAGFFTREELAAIQKVVRNAQTGFSKEELATYKQSLDMRETEFSTQEELASLQKVLDMVQSEFSTQDELLSLQKVVDKLDMAKTEFSPQEELANLQQVVGMTQTGFSTPEELANLQQVVGMVQTGFYTQEELAGLQQLMGTAQTECSTQEELAGLQQVVGVAQTGFSNQKELASLKQVVGMAQTGFSTQEELASLWCPQYAFQLMAGLLEVLNDPYLHDVTLVCSDGRSVKSNKLFLAAFSSYFRQNLALQENEMQLPEITLEVLDVFLVFMYRGNVHVSSHLRPSVMEAANILQIRGFPRDSWTSLAQIELSHQKELERFRCPLYVFQLMAGLLEVLKEPYLQDVTLVCCDDRSVKSNKLLLAACSLNFRQSLALHGTKVYLPEITAEVMDVLLGFMYRGNVHVSSHLLPSVIEAATTLQIRGFQDACGRLWKIYANTDIMRIQALMPIAAKACNSKNSMIATSPTFSVPILSMCDDSFSKDDTVVEYNNDDSDD